jgi:hypothetical protein
MWKNAPFYKQFTLQQTTQQIESVECKQYIWTEILWLFSWEDFVQLMNI